MINTFSFSRLKEWGVGASASKDWRYQNDTLLRPNSSGEMRIKVSREMSPPESR